MANNFKIIGTGSSRVLNSINSIDSRRVGQIKRINEGINDLNKKNNTWAMVNVGGQAVSAVGSIISSAGADVWGTAIQGVGAVASGIAGYMSNKNQMRINSATARKQLLDTYYSSLTSNLGAYGQSLENRDDIIYSARENIKSTITEMNYAYGSQFTNAIRGLFYSKNGIDSSVMSLFNGNFKTFNEMGEGEVAGWNDSGEFDTSDIVNEGTNYFNENLSDIQLGDLNKSLTNKLYNMLMSADTTFSRQVGAYETEVKDLISNALTQRREYVTSLNSQIEQLASQKGSDALNNALSIGQAEASRAVSGLRGVSASSNVELQKLANKLADLEYGYQQGYILSQARNAIRDMQVSTASSIAKARANESLALKQATESAISGWNKLASNARTASREANKQLNEAYIYQTEADRDTESIVRVLGGGLV